MQFGNLSLQVLLQTQCVPFRVPTNIRAHLISSNRAYRSITLTRSLTFFQFNPTISLHVAYLATTVARDVSLLALLPLLALRWLPLYHTQVYMYRPLLLLALSWWFLLLLWLLLT